MKPKLSPEELILMILDIAGGRMAGKTLLQKRAFFVCRTLGLSGVFRAHYYGPFSPAIDHAIGRAKAVGFIQEEMQGFGKVDRVGFEWRRYDYSLTTDGRKVLAEIKKQAPRQFTQIQECLRRMEEAGDNGDYVSLSIAAKTYFIVTQNHPAASVQEIQSAANKLGWSIQPQEADKATMFLKKMNLLAATSE